MVVPLENYKVIQRKILFDQNSVISRVLNVQDRDRLTTLISQKAGSKCEITTFFDYFDPVSSVYQGQRGYQVLIKVGSPKWAPTTSRFSDRELALTLVSFLLHLEVQALTHVPTLRALFDHDLTFSDPFSFFKPRVTVISIYQSITVQPVFLTIKQALDPMTLVLTPALTNQSQKAVSASYSNALAKLVSLS